MPKRHFQTFDALRFFAFLKVFLLHLPITAFPVFNFLKAGGGIGVQFFFMLSGFLITYIIYEEKQRQGYLNLKKFYARRLLRIWPLYYLAVVFAYLTPLLVSALGFQVSDEGYTPDPWFSFTFLENYKMILTRDHPNVAPLTVLWSLCIEEHFYLVWGILLYFVKLKRLPWVIFGAIIIANTSRIIFIANGIPTIEILTNIDLFAYGAIPAYLLLHYPERFDKFIPAITFWLKFLFGILLLAAVLLFPHYKAPYSEIISTAILGILFSILVCLIIPVKTNFRIAENNIFSRLGIFTFGLYVFHTVVIGVLNLVFKKLSFSLELPFYAFLFSLLALGITIIVSMLSYYFFEKPFLQLKKYFY